MASSGFRIVSDSIDPYLAKMSATGMSITTKSMEKGARLVEQDAKQNAPWTDITGQAREGLIAEVYTDSGEVVLTLAHQVEYGVWLETIQNGKYAIIIPTL